MSDVLREVRKLLAQAQARLTMAAPAASREDEARLDQANYLIVLAQMVLRDSEDQQQH